VVFVSEVEKSGFEGARKLIFQMAELKNRLREFGVIRDEGIITDEYAKWFCSKKFGLELYGGEEGVYDALSKFGERVRIISRTASDVDFALAFEGICLDDFDFLLLVFINKESWMISAIYRVSFDVIKKFLSDDGRFKWNRESRSLSLQLYPGDNNMIFL